MLRLDIFLLNYLKKNMLGFLVSLSENPKPISNAEMRAAFLRELQMQDYVSRCKIPAVASSNLTSPLAGLGASVDEPAPPAQGEPPSA